MHFSLAGVVKPGKKGFVMSLQFMKKLMNKGYSGVQRWHRKVDCGHIINSYLKPFDRLLFP